MVGLICYGTGSAMAIVTTDFSVLLLARMVAAMGATAGSVVVQTMLRDRYESTAPARVFSVMGVALALSPVFGLVSGGWLVSLYCHTGVFIALASLAILLLILATVLLPETRPENTLRIRGGEGGRSDLLHDSGRYALEKCYTRSSAEYYVVQLLQPGSVSFQAAGVELRGIRMGGNITGTCFTFGQSPEPENVNDQYNTGTAGRLCMYSGSAFRCCCLVVAALGMDTCTGSRNCNYLWHSDTQRAEQGATPLSRTGRGSRSIVRLELLC